MNPSLFGLKNLWDSTYFHWAIVDALLYFKTTQSANSVKRLASSRNARNVYLNITLNKFGVSQKHYQTLITTLAVTHGANSTIQFYSF